MSKKYDYELAKRLIQMKSDVLSTAQLGMEEDWFWTAETVYENGQFQIDLTEEPEIAGISGSGWATPTILLTYKDGRQEFVDCYTGESNGVRPVWFDLGVLSSPCQDWVESVKVPKLESK
jgi:hypothetical protein